MNAHDHATPDTSRRPIERLLSPIQTFFKVEAAGGILLLVCTVVALVWANSGWSDAYHDLWNLTVTVGAGSFVLQKPLELWVNDGLMAVFFFVVGLEIKRELLEGELATLRQAAIPVTAAVGGMLMPALFYVAVNLGGAGMQGWAIPAATDIAFALGVMALLGRRVPTSLKIFLTAVAIVDDIGAVLIIAAFYTSEISQTALGVAGGMLVLLIIANRLHIRWPLVYGLLGIVMWVAFLKSGVHATIAGVLVAFTVPARVRIDSRRFVDFSRGAIKAFDESGKDEADLLRNQSRQMWVYRLEDACEAIQPPLLRLEHALLPWVSFFIMPVFALANAGVTIGEGLGEALASPISIGIVLGLVLGKQIGITLFTWLAFRLGLGDLPAGTTWRQIHAASCLAGIGFTMSLFIANLGFGAGDELEGAKLGILGGSLIAGAAGWFLLRLATQARSSGTTED